MLLWIKMKHVCTHTIHFDSNQMGVLCVNGTSRREWSCTFIDAHFEVKNKWENKKIKKEKILTNPLNIWKWETQFKRFFSQHTAPLKKSQNFVKPIFFKKTFQVLKNSNYRIIKSIFNRCCSFNHHNSLYGVKNVYFSNLFKINCDTLPDSVLKVGKKCQGFQSG